MREIEHRKQTWVDFQNLQSPVNRLLVIDCHEGMPERPMLWWENAQARVEWAYERYQRQLDNLSVIHDHTVPYLSMITGTEIFAEAFGCKVHKPHNNNPFALPLVTNALEAVKVCIPRLEDTNMMRLFDMARQLKAKAGDDALLSLPDIQTPGDIAALIWEKTDLYVAMLECPEAVLELTDKIREFMFHFLDLWFESFGKETIAHYPDYYMPYGITMSEDEIGAVSGEMFDTFFASELALFSERYGAIGIHCCADSKHQWENLKRIPNLKLINLHRNPRQTLESMKSFGAVCAQMPSESFADPDALPNAQKLHIANFISVETKKDACARMDAFYQKYPHLNVH